MGELTEKTMIQEAGNLSPPPATDLPSVLEQALLEGLGVLPLR